MLIVIPRTTQYSMVMSGSVGIQVSLLLEEATLARKKARWIQVHAALIVDQSVSDATRAKQAQGAAGLSSWAAERWVSTSCSLVC